MECCLIKPPVTHTEATFGKRSHWSSAFTPLILYFSFKSWKTKIRKDHTRWPQYNKIPSAIVVLAHHDDPSGVVLPACALGVRQIQVKCKSSPKRREQTNLFSSIGSTEASHPLEGSHAMQYPCLGNAGQVCSIRHPLWRLILMIGLLTGIPLFCVSFSA